MNNFLDAFATLPENAKHLRRRHLDAFLRQGLPSKTQEDWRYTDLAALAERPFALAEAATPSLPVLPGVETIAFANGRRVAGAAALAVAAVPDLTPSPVTALNAAFSLAGLELDILPGVTRAPLHLVTWFGGAANGMAHLRHRLRLARGASAHLIVHELGDDATTACHPERSEGSRTRSLVADAPRDDTSADAPRHDTKAAFFATQVFEIELAEGSRLQLDRIQQFAPGTTALTRMDVRVGRNACFTSAGLYGGGTLVRNDINIALDAPGAEAGLHGVLAPAAGEHLDVHTRLDHRAPQGRSREGFRCIVPEKARAIFNGKVVVHAGAQKTDSEQHVDSLLLAPGAEVNAKPELEIFADDVKCAHGATCGQLDEDAIYYLRSRGLDLAASRNLLLYTFAHEMLARIGSEPARKLAGQSLLARLPGAQALEELL